MKRKENEKTYHYSVMKIHSVGGNAVTCNVLKYRVWKDHDNHAIPTSLTKWMEMRIELTGPQMEKFNNMCDEDGRRAYLTKLLILS